VVGLGISEASAVSNFIYRGWVDRYFLNFPDSPSTNCKKHGSFGAMPSTRKWGKWTEFKFLIDFNFLKKNRVSSKKRCEFMDTNEDAKQTWELGKRSTWCFEKKKHPLNYHQHLHPTSINHNSNTANPLT